MLPQASWVQLEPDHMLQQGILIWIKLWQFFSTLQVKCHLTILLITPTKRKTVFEQILFCINKWTTPYRFFRLCLPPTDKEHSESRN
jgi:hypothetical protein